MTPRSRVAAHWGARGTAVAVFLAGVGPLRAASLQSDPPGASVRLEGKVHISGTTQVPLDDLQQGSYRLFASGPGLDHSLARFSFDPGGEVSTHPYTNGLSLLWPPGLGHRRQGSSSRGLIFASSFLGGLAGTTVAHFDVRDAKDDQELAQSRYDGATNPTEAAIAREALLSASQEVDDDQEVLTLWALYSGAAWAGAAVETWLLTPRPQVRDAGGGRYVLSIPRASSASAALRSALVPGSGQRFLGHEGRGSLFTGLVSVFSAGAIIAHRSYLSAARDQERTQRLLDEAETETAIVELTGQLLDAQDKTRDRDRIRLALGGTAVVTYLWNVIDAAVMGQDKADLRRFSWNVSPTWDGLLASVSWRIS